MVGVARVGIAFFPEVGGRPLFHGGPGSPDSARRFVGVAHEIDSNSAEAGSALYNPIAVILFFLPLLVAPYQVTLLTYGLIFAIAALGFNLLLGCTGLLSFVIPLFGMAPTPWPSS